jgi:ribonuclease P protein component
LRNLPPARTPLVVPFCLSCLFVCHAFCLSFIFACHAFSFLVPFCLSFPKGICICLCLLKRATTPMTLRLRKHADYQFVYAHTRRQQSRHFAYFAMARPMEGAEARRSETPGPRIGLTVPKAMLPRAHDRNRMKRRVREAIRAQHGLLEGAVDVILHPRRPVLTLEYAALLKEVALIFRSAQAAAIKSAPAVASKSQQAAASKSAQTAAVTPALSNGQG